MSLTTIDNGFDSYSDEASLTGSIWATAGTGGNAKADTAQSVNGGVSMRLYSGLFTDWYVVANEKVSSLSADGAEYRWWMRGDTLSGEDIQFYTANGAEGTGFFFRHRGGNVDVYVPSGREGASPYNTSGYHTVGTYTNNTWYQYRVVLNFTADTFTLWRRTSAGDAWTQLGEGGSTTAIPQFSANTGASEWTCQAYNVSSAHNVWIDDLQYDPGTLSLSKTASDAWSWSDTAAFPPSVGSLGAGSVDYQGRVTFTATEGALAPSTWKVYRSADNSTWAEITSRCSLVDNGSTWTIIDKRPAYGSQAIAWGGTGYYKVRAYNGSTPSSADTSVVTVTGIDVDANASEKAQWDALHTVMATQATRENDTHLNYPYSGHWLIAAANVAHKYADKRTQALADLNTWWTYVKGTQRTAAKLYKSTASAYGGYIYSEHCWRAVRDWIMCAYLIQEHDPTLAADLFACADETARATIDLLGRGGYTAAGYGAGWPDPAGATAWAGSTARSAGDVRRPTTGNGRMYRVISAGGTTGSSEPTWPTTDRGCVVDGTVTWQDCTNDLPRFQTSHAYSLGEIVRPTTGNGHTYRVTTAGTSGGSEPTWPTTVQGTVTSGGVTFRETGVAASNAIFMPTYEGSSPYGAIGFTPATDNDFTLETAAALAALVGTPACTNFTTGGSYRTTALSLLTDNVNAGLTMQVGIGASIKAPLFIEQYDSNYAVWSYEKLLTVTKFAGSLIPHAQAALTRFMDWLASDLSTEPRWSNGGDIDGYSSIKYRWECMFRADLYRAQGLAQPSFRPDKLLYSSAMVTDLIYAEGGQATSGFAGFTEGSTLVLPALHYGVYAALPSNVTAGDTWGWTDAPVKTLPRAIGDTWGWTDSPTRAIARPRAAADTWGWSDAATRSGGGTQTAGDSWAWADSPTRTSTRPRAPSDTWGWSDAAARSPTTRTRTPGDSWGWSDTAARTTPPSGYQRTNTASQIVGPGQTTCRMVAPGTTSCRMVSPRDTSSRIVDRTPLPA